MKKLSKETCELMAKLKDAVQKEGGICIITLGKGKYLSQAAYGSADEIIALLCCAIDNVADHTGEKPISILMKMTSLMLEVGEEE